MVRRSRRTEPGERRPLPPDDSVAGQYRGPRCPISGVARQATDHRRHDEVSGLAPVGRSPIATSSLRATYPQSSERLPEFHADGARLIHEQPRTTRSLRRKRAVIPEIRDLVGQVLAYESNLERAASESKSRIDKPVSGA